jgi:hypothetical protein
MVYGANDSGDARRGDPGPLSGVDHRARRRGVFCEFEAPSQAAVAEANRRAGVAFDRIVPAVAVSPAAQENQ